MSGIVFFMSFLLGVFSASCTAGFTTFIKLENSSVFIFQIFQEFKGVFQISLFAPFREHHILEVFNSCMTYLLLKLFLNRLYYIICMSSNSFIVMLFLRISCVSIVFTSFPPPPFSPPPIPQLLQCPLFLLKYTTSYF